MQRTQYETDNKLLLSVCEVAQLLGIGRNLAYELVREKRLPHIRLGRRILIPRQTLSRWLSNEMTATADEPGLRLRY